MSGIHVRAHAATANLWCDGSRCGVRWESELFAPGAHGDEVSAVRPALDAGWRVFAGGRGQRTYCPDHGPKTALRLVLGVDR